MKIKRFVIPTAIVILWQASVSLNLFSPLLLPSPLSILKRMVLDILSGELVKGFSFSILMILGASLPSLFIALIMAFLSVRSKKANSIFESFSALAHPLPGIALLPLLILWTGLGAHIIWLIVIHSVLWPFYINIRNGFRQINPLWNDLAANNGLSPPDHFFHIMLPGSLPSLLSALKIGWARAWRAVISAEMVFGTIGTTGGLGWYIFNKRIFMDTPGMYGGIVLLMLTGLLMEKVIFGKAENAIDLRWGVRQ